MRRFLAYVLATLLAPAAAYAGELEDMAESLRLHQELDQEPRWGTPRQTTPSEGRSEGRFSLFGGRWGEGGGGFRLGGGSWSADRFLKIGLGEDWEGEHIIFRDNAVTAFLDISDPHHPKFSSGARVDEEFARVIPASRRVHILVTPNRKHEGLRGELTASELESTAQILRQSEGLAVRFGVKNPKVYINAHAVVKQLHVHIVGERDPKAAAYPRLAQPVRGRR